MTWTAPRRRRRGYSLVEVMATMAVMGVLIMMAAPTFQRAVEQSRADVAGANLRALWAAERLYWLDHRAYALGPSALTVLKEADLIDPTIGGSNDYVYDIELANGVLTITAQRTNSARWSGQFTANEAGLISGQINAAGETAIEPGFR